MTTALSIIKSAMRKAGVLTKGENPAADEAVDGLEMLNDMLASWSNDSMVVYARTLESFPLTTAIEYTIGVGGDFNTARPVKLIDAYVRSANIDYHLEIIDDVNYANITLKNTGGIPTFINYDNNYPLAKIKLYPAPTGIPTIYILSEKQLSEFTLNQTVNLPPGWKRALIYNLAIELSAEYGQSVTEEVVMIAKESKSEIRAAIMAARTMELDTNVQGYNNIYAGWTN